MNSISAEVSKSRKIALYRYLGESPFYSVMEVTYVDYDERWMKLPDGELRELPRDKFTRVSEPLDISFTSLNDDAIVEQALAALNEAERKAIEELNTRIANIRAQKAELLALTHQPESV